MNVLARVQALSGLAFAFFLGLHLATTVSAVAGPASYDGTLAALRAVYRAHPIVEFLLIGAAAAVHIACAILRIVERRKSGPHPKPDWRLRLHRYSGYFLMLAIVGHVYATRVMPALAGPPADFSYLAFSVIAWPYFISPYYFVLGISGATHLGLGLGYAAAALLPRAMSGPAVRRISVAAASIAGILVFAGVTGVIARSTEGNRSRFGEYRAMYDRYMPVMPPADEEALKSTSRRAAPAEEARLPLPPPRPSRGRW